MVELKTYKLEELEYGKIYKLDGYGTYRLYQGKLQWRANSERWTDSKLTYNELVDLEFTLLKEGHTFKKAIAALAEGLTIESYNGWKYKINLDSLKVEKTKDGMEITGLFDLDDGIFSYDEITNVWFIEKC